MVAFNNYNYLFYSEDCNLCNLDRIFEASLGWLRQSGLRWAEVLPKLSLSLSFCYHRLSMWRPHVVSPHVLSSMVAPRWWHHSGLELQEWVFSENSTRNKYFLPCFVLFSQFGSQIALFLPQLYCMKQPRAYSNLIQGGEGERSYF